MSVREQVQKKAKKPFKICYDCYEIDNPIACNDCENFQEMVKVSDVFLVLDSHVCVSRKQLRKMAHKVLGSIKPSDEFCKGVIYIVEKLLESEKK